MNDGFELPDGFYSVSDIQDYIKYIIKKHKELLSNAAICIYINRINNTLIFENKKYIQARIASETTKLKKITGKAKNGENVPSLEVAEVVLVQYNLVNNQYKENIWGIIYF